MRILNLNFSMRFVTIFEIKITWIENNTIPKSMNSNIIDISIKNILNIAQVGWSVIGISVLPEKIWSDQGIFENVCFFFFLHKNYFILFSNLFQKVFFYPNDLKQKKTLTTFKVKKNDRISYILYILQSCSDQNKINLFWLDNQQQLLPLRYW